MQSDQREPAAEDVAFGAMVLRFLDGDLSAAEHAQLVQRLCDDAAARDAFVAMCVEAGQFREIFTADELTTGELEEDDLLVAPASPPPASRWRKALSRLTRPASISLMISAVAIGGLLALLAWYNVPTSRPTKFRWAEAPQESLFVARLVRPPTARWADGAPGFADGTLLLAGERLDLASGTVDIIFDDGAQVTLTGPAQFVVVSPARGRLESGRLTGLVPPQAVGFAIRTSHVDVVDLGTEFGVLARPSGETEVHVFQGAVRVEAYDFEMRRTLSAGQALRILPSGQLLAEAAKPGSFTRRSLPTVAVAAEDSGAIVDDFDNSQFQLGGWAGPWALHGSGRVSRDVEHPLTDSGGAYLRVNPTNAEVRTLHRKFVKTGNVDPSQPHIIRWQWRFDGDPLSLTNFHDRVHFFADSMPCPGTTFTIGWLIGISFGVEREAQPPIGKWFFFDSRKSGKHSDAFVEANMVNTGMSLRPGAVYQFEVQVNPAAGTYSATVFDGVEKFSAEGMHYRSGKPGTKSVLHFGGCASAAADNHAFSLDSIEIRGIESNAEEVAEGPVE